MDCLGALLQWPQLDPVGTSGRKVRPANTVALKVLVVMGSGTLTPAKRRPPAKKKPKSKKTPSPKGKPRKTRKKLNDRT